MWIVQHGHRLLDVIHGVQLGNYGIFKTLAPCHCEYGPGCHTHRTIFLTNILVMVSAFWLFSDKGLTELGEGISQYQDVLFTIP